MKTVYVASALVVACAYIVTYSQACCHKELVVGLSGLGLLGHGGHGLYAPSNCGCGCDCDLCLPALHSTGCGCDLCAPACGCGCGGINICLTKKLKKKKKSIIKEYC